MKRMNKNKTVLIVAAHPDDELLGCGATVAKLIQQGAQAISVILGEGMTSRDVIQEKAVPNLHKDALKANEIIGIKKVHFENLPDNRFDTVALLDIVKLVEKYVRTYSPDILLTHFEYDLNVDHGITFRAVMTACRPQPGFKYPDIYTFEIPSSTDYSEIQPQNMFVPNVHIDVSEHIDLKLKALAAYHTEMRDYPHTRSLEAIKVMAQHRGVKVGLKFAEAFQLIRKISPALD